MTYEEAKQFIQEASKTGSILGLKTIRHLMHVLGDVHLTLPVIHIAGTNGKGSVGAYLYSIFHEAGLHVGRYTSPAVFDPMEVWQYDGRMMTHEEYARIMTRVRSACEQVVREGGAMPTVFEIETAAAFVYFAEKPIDVVLMEVGMGGETDATNVIEKPLCSVITTISFDHMQFLGKSLEDIARIKCGIIKPGCPVYSAPQEPAVEAVIRQVAQEKNCIIGVVKEDRIRLVSGKPGELKCFYKDIPLTTQMAGHYQMYNAALACKVAFHRLPELLPEYDDMKMRRVARIVIGIERATWPGRFETIGRDPLFIIDGAHNEGAALELAKTVRCCFKKRKLVYIIGVLADKEHKRMLEIMQPFGEKVYTVTPGNQRALSAEELAEEARAYYSEVTACETVEEAVRLALREKEPVLAFGSLSYLQELEKAYSDLINRE